MSLIWRDESSKKDGNSGIRPLVIVGIMAAFIISGCAKKVNVSVPLAPGFVNLYDQETYAALYTAQETLTQARVGFGNNLQAIPLLNTAMKTYNDALAGYVVYHAAAVSNPSASHSSLDNLMAIMAGAMAALVQQFGPPKPISLNGSNFRLIC